jgi:hypothetical protein
MHLALNRRQSLQFMTIAWILFVGGFSDSARCDERAEQILVQASRPLTLIQSIEFRAEEDSVASELPKGPKIKLPEGFTGRSKAGYVFRSNGNAYRVDRTAADGRALVSTAFNGSVYQLLIESKLIYAESKTRMSSEPQTPFPHPISWAYFWAYPTGSVMTWEDLRSGKTWNDAAKQSRFVREVKKGDKTTLTVEVQRLAESGQTYLYSVEFDKDRGFAPMSWSSYLLPNRTPSTSVVVTRWTNADGGDAGRIRLPIEVSMNSGGREGVYRIAEDSLRINRQIDDDVFTLPRSRAKQIADLPSNKSEPAESKRGLQIAIVLINVLVGMFIIAWLWRRRSRRR